MSEPLNMSDDKQERRGGRGVVTVTEYYAACPRCTEAAAFLDGLAGYLEREADAAASTFRERDLRQEAAECRAMAARLRGEQ